jgi:hypothetical protein
MKQESNNICEICMESMTGGDINRVVALFPCGHVFDEACWTKWADWSKGEITGVAKCCKCRQTAKYVGRIFIDLSCGAQDPISTSRPNDATGAHFQLDALCSRNEVKVKKSLSKLSQQLDAPGAKECLLSTRNCGNLFVAMKQHSSCECISVAIMRLIFRLCDVSVDFVYQHDDGIATIVDALRRYAQHNDMIQQSGWSILCKLCDATKSARVTRLQLRAAGVVGVALSALSYSVGFLMKLCKDSYSSKEAVGRHPCSAICILKLLREVATGLDKTEHEMLEISMWVLKLVRNVDGFAERMLVEGGVPVIKAFCGIDDDWHRSVVSRDLRVEQVFQRILYRLQATNTTGLSYSDEMAGVVVKWT